MYYVKWINDVKWLKICILNTSWIKLEISLSYLLYHLYRINFNQLHLGQWVKYGDLLFVTCISIKTCRWAGWCKLCNGYMTICIFIIHIQKTLDITHTKIKRWQMPLDIIIESVIPLNKDRYAKISVLNNTSCDELTGFMFQIKPYQPFLLFVHLSSEDCLQTKR